MVPRLVRRSHSTSDTDEFDHTRNEAIAVARQIDSGKGLRNRWPVPRLLYYVGFGAAQAASDANEIGKFNDKHVLCRFFGDLADEYR
jgi:hypothetical protein